jgi:gamma-glutamylcyclotransferase (GGCT)/AIG2-like uncharacterized protein YtfP
MRFFVYGTMSEGMVHWSKISEMMLTSVPAMARGSVWRLKVGYPVLLKEGSDGVPGQLVELQSSELLLSLLDEFHGFNRFDAEKSLFQREETFVLPDGQDQPVQTWIYYLNPRKLPRSAKMIAGGDWRQSLESEPALTEKLTERQKCYLMKLGSATGREIVPINDMSLYRELMNLELIVDKGRRLALSPFGHEVVRYLG